MQPPSPRLTKTGRQAGSLEGMGWDGMGGEACRDKKSSYLGVLGDESLHHQILLYMYIRRRISKVACLTLPRVIVQDREVS